MRKHAPLESITTKPFGDEPGGHRVKENDRHKSKVKRKKCRESTVAFSQVQELVEPLPLGLRRYAGKESINQFVVVRDGKHTWIENKQGWKEY